MADILRVRDMHEGRYYLVDGSGEAAADGDGDALIRRPGAGEDRPRAAGPAEAAAFFRRHFVAPYPGAHTPDGRFVCCGRLNAREAARFERGEAVRGRRRPLEEHLDYFDHAPADAMITPAENYVAWRALGFGVFGALLKTLLSSILFGRFADAFAIDIDRVGAMRPAGGTRIYDEKGDIDQRRLAPILDDFDEAARRAGTAAIPQAEALQIIRRHAHPGLVSAGQFRSLFGVCARLNNGKTISRAQLQALFDGSLLMLAASFPGRDGHTRLETLAPRAHR